MGARGELKVTADLAAPGEIWKYLGRGEGEGGEIGKYLWGRIQGEGAVWNYLRGRVEEDGELDKCFREEEREKEMEV